MPNPSRISAITKTTCKRVLSSLYDLGIEDFDIVVQGNSFRIVVRSGLADADNDIADRIDAA